FDDAVVALHAVVAEAAEGPPVLQELGAVGAPLVDVGGGLPLQAVPEEAERPGYSSQCPLQRGWLCGRCHRAPCAGTRAHRGHCGWAVWPATPTVWGMPRCGWLRSPVAMAQTCRHLVSSPMNSCTAVHMQRVRPLLCLGSPLTGRK